MRKKTTCSVFFFVSVILLLISAVMSGPVFEFFRGLVTDNYTTAYYHIFAALLIIPAAAAVAECRLGVAKALRVWTCAAAAVIGIAAYILLYCRGIGFSFFGERVNLITSRNAVALFAAFEAALAVAAAIEKRSAI